MVESAVSTMPAPYIYGHVDGPRRVKRRPNKEWNRVQEVSQLSLSRNGAIVGLK